MVTVACNRCTTATKKATRDAGRLTIGLFRLGFALSVLMVMPFDGRKPISSTDIDAYRRRRVFAANIME